MSRTWTRRSVLSVGGVALATSGAGCLGSSGTDGTAPETDWGISEPLAVERAQQYNATGCSCCEAYAAYLRDNVDGTVAETSVDDTSRIKRQHGVPSSLQSCHTVVFDDYVVEGHVPVAAIEQLLEETPSIDGIALPGMPAGSPGMGGETQGTLTVRAFADGQPGAVFAEF